MSAPLPPPPHAAPPPPSLGPPPIPEYQYTQDGLHRWRAGMADWEPVPVARNGSVLAEIPDPRPAKPVALPVLVENIPVDLKLLPQWLVWKYVWMADKKKWDKPPRNAHTGTVCAGTDADNWSSFADAEASYRAGGHDGTGFMPTAEDPLCGVDLDHCRSRETGAVKEWALAIVRRLNSYTEVSPSGSGLRVWIKARKRQRDRSSRAYEDGKVEIYDHDHYLTVTGQHLDGTPAVIEERQAEYEALRDELFPGKIANTDSIANIATPGVTAFQVLEIARQHENWPKWEGLLRGDLSAYNDDHSAADEALCCLAAFITRDPATIDQLVRSSGLIRPKWDAKRGASTYGAQTIEKALATVTETYDHGAAALKEKVEARHAEKVEQQRAAAAAPAGSTPPAEVDGTVGKPIRVEVEDTQPARFSFIFGEHGEEALVCTKVRDFWTPGPFDQAYMARFTRASHWDRTPRQHQEYMNALIDLAEHRSPPPELTDAGKLADFLSWWLGRAGDDPEQLERRGVWLDAEHERYVFRFADAIRGYRQVNLLDPNRLDDGALADGIRRLGGQVSLLRLRVVGKKQERFTWLPTRSFPEWQSDSAL